MLVTPMKTTVNQLAEQFNLSFKGDGECEINGVGTLQSATSGQITFLSNPSYKKYLSDTQASVVILAQEHAEQCKTTHFVVDDPYYIYSQIAQLFDETPKPQPGTHPSAVIHKSVTVPASASIGANVVIDEGVQLAEGVTIDAGCVIGEYCTIGKNTRLFPNVTLYHRTSIGSEVVIHANVVIGSDGFGISKHKNRWHKVPQLGRVIIGDEVEIGASTTIDRGAIDDTVLERGVKLDNQVQIAHNVRVGEYTAIAGCTGVAGSTQIGKNCIIGGMAQIAGHLTIADGVVLAGGATVGRHLKEQEVYVAGMDVLPYRAWRKNSAWLRRLDEMMRRLISLEKQSKKEEL